MTSHTSRKQIIALMLFSGVLMTATLHAAPRYGRAVVVGMTNGSEGKPETDAGWQNLRRGTVLNEGSSARTGANSVADLSLTTDSRVRLTSKTIIRLDQLREDTKGLPEPGKSPAAVTSIELETGKILVRADAPTPNSSFAVTTRACLSEARGFGSFSISMMNDRACVRVMNQSVSVSIRGRTAPVVVQAGQQLYISCDKKTNQATDVDLKPTPITEADPDWSADWATSGTLPPVAGPDLKSPPVYEISPSKL